MWSRVAILWLLRKAVFASLGLVSILLLVSIIWSRDLPQIEKPRKYFRDSTWNELNEDSVILYDQLYLDYRFSGDGKSAVVRGITFQKCNSSREFHVSYLGKRLGVLTSEPLEGECPFHWAPSCKWNAHMISGAIQLKASKAKADGLRISDSSNPYLSIDVQDVVKIGSPHRRGGMQPKFSNQLAVCVPPLYLYADWVQMVQFLQIWLNMGADKFYVYTSSISKTVDSILRVYEEKGRVKRIVWPALPKSNKTDPNSSLYRFGLVAALNDCLLRNVGVTRFLAIAADFDEFILPVGDNGKQTLPPFLTKLSELYPEAGSFRFDHFRLFYPTQQDGFHFPSKVKLKSFNLTQLRKLNVEKTPKKGPTKVIVRPERVGTTVTHDVRKLLYPFKRQRVDRSDAALFHLRKVPGKEALNAKHEPFHLFDRHFRSASLDFQTLLSQYSEDLPAVMESDHQVTKQVTVCLSKWKSTGCKVPHKMCESTVLQDKEKWIIYDEANEEEIENSFLYL